MKLTWNLFVKNMRPHGQLERKLGEKISKLETHLTHFPEDAVHLQVNLQRGPEKARFTAGLTLRLPCKMLHARKSALDPIPAFDQATKALLRELVVLKAALRHQSDWSRFPLAKPNG